MMLIAIFLAPVVPFIINSIILILFKLIFAFDISDMGSWFLEKFWLICLSVADTIIYFGFKTFGKIESEKTILLILISLCFLGVIIMVLFGGLY